MSIFISGSMAYDRIMTFPGLFEDHILPDKLHIINVSFMIDRVEERCGGTAGNIAYGLALLEQKPTVLASVGSDFYRYEKKWKELGLSPQGIRVVEDEFTALAFITTDLSDNQITGFCASAMKFPCDYKFEGLNSSSDYAVIAAGNIDDMLAYPALYRKAGVRFIYDPSQQMPMLSGEQLEDGIKGSHIFISNDYELQMAMNATGRSKEELLELAENIVTTLGAQGCILMNKNGETHVPAVQTDAVVDPTGAGDALRSGLLYGLHTGKSLEESLQLGTVVSSFCIEHYGTQEYKFNLDTYMDRYNKAFGKD